MSVLKKLNFADGTFNTKKIVGQEEKYGYTMNDENVVNLKESIVKEGKKDIEDAEKKYNSLEKESANFVDLLSKALSKVFFEDDFNNVKDDQSKSLEAKNKELLIKYKNAENKFEKEK